MVHKHRSSVRLLGIAIVTSWCCCSDESGPDPVIRFEGYRTSCTSDDECAAFPFGDYCECAGPEKAINIADREKWYAAQRSSHSRCPGLVCDWLSPVYRSGARCNAQGQCELAPRADMGMAGQ